jgi:hypothetical protein
VSHAGSDDGSACGRSRDKPCRRLDYVTNVAAEKDVIYVDDANTSPGESQQQQQQPGPLIYRLNCRGNDDGTGGKLLKSLTIVALRGRPRIACDPLAISGSDSLRGPGDGGITRQPSDHGGLKSGLVASSSSFNRCAVTIDNSTLVDVIFDVDECHVTVRHSLLVRSLIATSSPRCRQVRLRASDTRWYGNRKQCDRRYDAGCLDAGGGDTLEAGAYVTEATVSYNVTCAEVDAVFERVESVLGAIQLLATRSLRLRINGSRFVDDVDDKGNQFHGGLHLTFSALSSVIELIDTNFTRQVSERAWQPCQMSTEGLTGHTFPKTKLRFAFWTMQIKSGGLVMQ